MRIAFITILVAVLSCNNNPGNNTFKDSAAKSSDGGKIAVLPGSTDFTKDSIITIRFPKDSSSISVRGKINGINKPVTVFIPITKGSHLKVLLIPEEPIANIRINQVFMPDGKADGPFGRSLDIKIGQQGDYKLIIGENLMQGDEWKGRFTLSVSVN